MDRILLILLSVVITTFAFAQKSGDFIDKRDGRTYKWIKIERQIWMAANLAFKSDSGCWAYSNDSSYIDRYGYLYSWETAKIACPNGWHLPYREDFKTLLKNAGPDSQTAYLFLSQEGPSGFSFLLGGSRRFHGNYNYMGKNAYFWSSSCCDSSNAWFLYVVSFRAKTFIYCSDFVSGFSVRCLKN